MRNLSKNLLEGDLRWPLNPQMVGISLMINGQCAEGQKGSLAGSRQLHEQRRTMVLQLDGCLAPVIDRIVLGQEFVRVNLSFNLKP